MGLIADADDAHDFRQNLVIDDDGIGRLVQSSRRIAVLGIKTEQQADQPSFYVPRYLAEAGLEIIPVPVYYPTITMILGRTVFRKLVDVPGPIDLLDVFRRSVDLPQHVDDILAKRPRAVWFQSGIRDDTIAVTLARAGIKVVQDRCLMVEHRKLARIAPSAEINRSS